MMNELKKLVEIGSKDGYLHLNVLEKFSVDPEKLAGMCYLLYYNIINLIPENKQIMFKDAFLSIFVNLLQNGDHYIEEPEEIK